ncbi:hypothetical protein V6N12_037994 [Hibiscus sabdariffa]|uniref:RNase H type-1 domain-containing protein n=1 Tax=Hibiscus sabdariffa TaxID=183260 RepID=A0ABR2BDH5_9ROSI
MGWRIGSGENINVWSEPWLPGPNGGFVRNQSINCNYTRVSDLIDAPTATWKVDVLEALFDEDHVQRICAIPLSTSGLHDELFWRYDGTGYYIVKSDYRLLREEIPNTSGMSASSSLHLSKFFSELWAITLPAKVKISVWRIVNNFMPTFDNLHGRRLVVVNCCPIYKSSVETIEHTMRDLFLRENEMLSSQACLRPLRSHEDWRALSADMVKCNFDAAYESLSMKSISGVICRDSDGCVLAACSTPHWFVAGPFHAEALACLVAVKFAGDLGFSRVIVEGER